MSDILQPVNCTQTVNVSEDLILSVTVGCSVQGIDLEGVAMTFGDGTVMTFADGTVLRF